MKETQYTIKSVHLGNERTVWVSEPEGAVASVTVLLDAELYRDRMGAVTLIDELRSRGELAPSLFVYVSFESIASRWLECPCHRPFARFIDEELFPWLESVFACASAARERVIVGLSYTGLAAAYIAMTVPLRFTKVIAQSGSFWWNDCSIVEYFEALEEKPKTEFYLEVGLRETEENVRHKEDVLQVVSQIEGVRRLRDSLLRHGYTPQYVEFDGGHDFTNWSTTLPAALRWALKVETQKQSTRQAAAPLFRLSN